jgi:hypothetical protein
MYTVSEIVEIDTAQNLILTEAKEVKGIDDQFPLEPEQDAYLDE